MIGLDSFISIIQIVVTVAAGIIVMLARRVIDDLRGTIADLQANVQRLDKDLNSHKLEVATRYATATEIRDVREDIGKRLDKIDDKLDRLIEERRGRTA